MLSRRSLLFICLWPNNPRVKRFALHFRAFIDIVEWHLTFKSRAIFATARVWRVDEKCWKDHSSAGEGREKKLYKWYTFISHPKSYREHTVPCQRLKLPSRSVWDSITGCHREETIPERHGGLSFSLSFPNFSHGSQKFIIIGLHPSKIF